MPASPPQLVVLDTETTGLDPDNDRVIDIGAVRLGPRLEIVDRFQTLVDPGMHIPLYVTRLVGIDDDDVRGAPSFAEAFARLTGFVGEAVIAGHNVGFDRDHLAAGARRAGAPPLHATWFDTLEAALLLYPELDRHALGIMAAELGLERQTHRALPDAEQAAELLRRLCARAAGLGPQERALLTAVAWEPLRLLDRFHAPPDEAPPPVVADEPSGPLSVVPVPPGGWRAELGAAAEDAAPEAAGAEGAETEAGRSADAPAGDAAAAGMAARLPGFRHRPGQLQLAAAVDEIFAGGGVGLFEAGTGMGKSLAYLLPAAFFSASQGRRVVVSTKTKALQRQLAAHELPKVADGRGAGLALGAADGPRELRLPAAAGRGRHRRGGRAARQGQGAGAGLPGRQSATRRGRPLRPPLPRLARARRPGRRGPRPALLAGHLHGTSLPGAPRLSLARGAHQRRGVPPGLRQPRPAAHRARTRCRPSRTS